MKAVKIDIGGEAFTLAYNSGAMFAVREEFEDTNKLLERIYKDTPEGLRDICRAAAILMEQGELIRRHMGHEPKKTPQAETLELIITPPELMELKGAIPKAIYLGFGREIKDDEGKDKVVDLGLAELLEKKRTF